jgi:peptidoglycan/xylan/chitin deacetylase (PgdA/CDA1 family)
VSPVLVIVGWHNATPTWCFPASGTDGPRGLRRQLLLLRKLGTVVDLGDALQRLRAGEELPPRAVALTFDDGYRDNLEVVVPILQEMGLPATFFVAPGLLARRVIAWWEELAAAFQRSPLEFVEFDAEKLPLTGAARLASFDQVAARMKRLTVMERTWAVRTLCRELEPEPYPPVENLFLDWQGAREVLRAGFAIGSHSDAHPTFSRESVEVQQRELSGSREELEDRLDVEVSLLAYPNGGVEDYDEQTVAAARAAGYVAAVTTVPGRNTRTTDPYRLHRTLLNVGRPVRSLGYAATHEWSMLPAGRRLVASAGGRKEG